MTDRPPVEKRVMAHLAALGFPFELLTCEEDRADTRTFCADTGYALENAANTLLVTSRGSNRVYAACVLLASTRLDNRTCRSLLGCNRTSFATTDDVRALTGMLVGGVTVFGLPENWPIYVDGRVYDQPFVILGSGARHGKIRISPDVFTVLRNVRRVNDLAVPVDEPDRG